MKNQNIYVSIVVVIVAVLLGWYILGRHVQAPVTTPGSDSGYTLQPSDQSGDQMDDPSSDQSDQSDGSDPSDASGTKQVTFSCDDQKSIMATFDLSDQSSLDIALSDGRAMTLSRGQSDSSDAAEYTNADGSLIFSLGQDGATITEGGNTTFSNCQISSIDGAPVQ